MGERQLGHRISRLSSKTVHLRPTEAPMSQTRRARSPRPSLHSTGQWRVRFHGRAFYLGTDEDTAMEQFYELRKRWKNGTLQANTPAKTVADLATERAELTVRQLVAVYHAHLHADQAADWLQRNEPEIRQATNLLSDQHGDVLARSYGPKRLKEVQTYLCSQKRRDGVTPLYTHKTANQKIRRIVDVFRHAVSEELVPPSVLDALRSVKPVRRGKPGTRDCKKVEPVTRAQVDAVLPYLTKPLASVVELLWLTGARPSEILRLRPCDIDRSQLPWTAELREHKTAYTGRPRFLNFGPRARKILENVLLRPAETHLFTPAEGAADASLRRRASRKTPIWPSHQRRYEQAKAARPRARRRDAYDAAALHRAIKRAIARCNRDRLRDGQKRIEPWFAYQIRHTAATRIRREDGIEAARVMLGHTSAGTTEIYTEMDWKRAAEIAERVG